jgi:hypothetical protein
MAVRRNALFDANWSVPYSKGKLAESKFWEKPSKFCEYINHCIFPQKEPVLIQVVPRGLVTCLLVQFASSTSPSMWPVTFVWLHVANSSEITPRYSYVGDCIITTTILEYFAAILSHLPWLVSIGHETFRVHLAYLQTCCQNSTVYELKLNGLCSIWINEAHITEVLLR